LILSLKLVSDSTKEILLRDILSRASYHDDFDSSELEVLPLDSLEFALQGNVEVEREELARFPRHYLVTITSGVDFEEEAEYQELEKEVHEALVNKRPPEGEGRDSLLGKICSDSRPDAWIYDAKKRFVFLIESKTMDADLYYSQVICHAANWLGLFHVKDILKKTIRIRWVDVYKTCETICKELSAETDKKILEDLLYYFEFNQIRPFKGFQWHELKTPPKIDFNLNTFNGLFWEKLMPPPEKMTLKINIET
jgi:hypothetical protein